MLQKCNATARHHVTPLPSAFELVRLQNQQFVGTCYISGRLFRGFDPQGQTLQERVPGGAALTSLLDGQTSKVSVYTQPAGHGTLRGCRRRRANDRGPLPPGALGLAQ